MLGIEFAFPEFRLALIRQCNLIFKVIEAVIDRCCREHQNFGGNAFADNPVHQSGVTVFTAIVIFIIIKSIAAIAEVVGFIDDNQTVVFPIQPIEIDAIGNAAVA